MRTDRGLSRARSLLSAAILLSAVGCAEPPQTAAAQTPPPIPPGQARIWFYRIWEPSESLNLAMVDMNGSSVGAVANGAAFYRDVAPGRYHVAPHSFARDFNQDSDIDAAAGQQLYIKIVSLVSWGSGNSASKNFARDAFYAWVIPPATAQREIPAERY